MKKEAVKHWMPVALLAVVLTTIIHDVGTEWTIWDVYDYKDNL